MSLKKRSVIPKEIVRKILDALREGGNTPTGLSRKIDYNRRTILKYIEVLEYLGFVKVVRLPIGNKTICICELKEKKKNV